MDRQPRARPLQFGIKAILAMMTLAGVLLGVNTFPPPAGPLLMKATGGILLFSTVAVAVYAAGWFESRHR